MNPRNERLIFLCLTLVTLSYFTGWLITMKYGARISGYILFITAASLAYWAYARRVQLLRDLYPNKEPLPSPIPQKKGEDLKT